MNTTGTAGNNTLSEPEWIRNPMAANVDVDTSAPENLETIITQICAGEVYHCEYCGVQFNFWPPLDWADHHIRIHGDNLTIMVRTNTSLMCVQEINEAKQIYFSVNFATRVSMRRRAWKLGYAVVKPGQVQIVQ